MPMPAEAMLTPGAVTFGFERAVAGRRPPRAEARETEVARVREWQRGLADRATVGGEQLKSRRMRTEDAALHAEERDRDVERETAEERRACRTGSFVIGPS